MKKIIYFLVSIIAATASLAQTYNDKNSIIRKAIVLYEKDSRGFFHKVENIDVPFVNDVVSTYAYDKKSQELYVKTEFGNCVITLEDKLAKVLKKNKSIPQLKSNDLVKAISDINESLEKEFKLLNERRQKEIEDSIAYRNKERQDSIAKAKADSVAKVITDSLLQIKLEQDKQSYIHNHSWKWAPVKNTTLRCSTCDNTVFGVDSILCAGFNNDTLYYITIEDLALGVNYLELHNMRITPNIMKDDKFSYHVNVFKDSLLAYKNLIVEDITTTNKILFYSAIEKIKHIAPYGYFDEWGWNREYGTVTFNFKYTNTNKNTIKYVDVYWKITNDVNDVRKTGHFKGTGPVEELETASWNWDYSSYYVAGDASNMEITKVILTYTNGSQKVLSKNMLHFDD